MNKEINDGNNSAERLKQAVANNKFAKVKDGWLKFKNGKPKVKFRKYISDKAKLLTRINDKNFAKNRHQLILAYDELGLDGVNDLIEEEVKTAQSKYKKYLEKQLKQQKDETTKGSE